MNLSEKSGPGYCGPGYSVDQGRRVRGRLGALRAQDWHGHLPPGSVVTKVCLHLGSLVEAYYI